MWAPAKYIQKKDTVHCVQRLDGEFEEIPIKQYKELPPLVASTITDIQDNLVMLSDFSEGAILHQIKERYRDDDVYTAVGRYI